MGADVADGGVDYVQLLRLGHGLGLCDGLGVGSPTAIEEGGSQFAHGIAVVIQQGYAGPVVQFRRGCVPMGYLPPFRQVGVMVGVLDQGGRDAAALIAEFGADFPFFRQGG